MEYNVLVKNSSWTNRDLEVLYDDDLHKNEEVILTSAIDIPNLLVELKCYQSTGQARRAGRTGPIPIGWTEFKASKKVKLWIWNPDCYERME